MNNAIILPPEGACASEIIEKISKFLIRLQNRLKVPPWACFDSVDLSLSYRPFRQTRQQRPAFLPSKSLSSAVQTHWWPGPHSSRLSITKVAAASSQNNLGCRPRRRQVC